MHEQNETKKMRHTSGGANNALQDMYDSYKAGALSRSDFEGRLFQRLLANPAQYRVFPGNETRWNEFVSSFYSRLSRAIDLYRDIGATFDNYIAGLVYNGAKEYRGRETERRITEYSCWQARARDLAVCENAGGYLSDDSEDDTDTPPNICPAAGRGLGLSVPRNIKRKHILLLLLKSYYFVSDDFTAKVAKAIGMDYRKVTTMIGELKKRREKNETEIQTIRERLFSQYYRYLALQEKLEAALPGSPHSEKMHARLERARKRFAVMKNRFSKMRRDAPNRLISEITGIPKGTVDSSLFYIKQQLGKHKLAGKAGKGSSEKSL
jgi:endonuclease III-like uncharacterized protein